MQKEKMLLILLKIINWLFYLHNVKENIMFNLYELFLYLIWYNYGYLIIYYTRYGIK